MGECMYMYVHEYQIKKAKLRVCVNVVVGMRVSTDTKEAGW